MIDDVAVWLHQDNPPPPRSSFTLVANSTSSTRSAGEDDGGRAVQPRWAAVMCICINVKQESAHSCKLVHDIFTKAA